MTETPKHKPRVGNRLTDLMLPRLKPGPLRVVKGKNGNPDTTRQAPKSYPDGHGLYFVVAGATSRHWLFRYKFQKRPRYLGLGSYPTVSLADARDKASNARKLIDAGKDPVAERELEKSADAIAAAAEAVATRAEQTTFAVCYDAWFKNERPGWKNDKHIQQVESSFETYAMPTLRNAPIGKVSVDMVEAVLRPHWTTKHETMSRLRGWMAAVFAKAKADGHFGGDNPAAWADNLKYRLPKFSRSESINHHPAMPYRAVPVFMVGLRKLEGIGPRCLEFTILNANRTSETTGMRWSEIDMDAAEWVVPANRIKAKKEHRVPLSDRSLAILKEMQGLSEEYVFPSRDGKGPLSSGAMLMLMERQKQGQFTVHGFRSSFRDWAAEQTDAPDPVCEACLAHAVPDAVVKSYKRTTFFDLRAELMQAWTDYCDRPEPMRAVKAEPKKTLRLRFKSAE